jgi:hypothetical protein
MLLRRPFDRLAAAGLRLRRALAEERGGMEPIQVIAIIAGAALIAAAVLAALSILAPEVGDRILEVFRRALGAASGD